ncbi:hypothetical protein Ddc_12571 [Ditylenchus destructor]|nr:hypothetical protein Ddc_12571 [Ditylenchus destructor]
MAYSCWAYVKFSVYGKLVEQSSNFLQACRDGNLERALIELNNLAKFQTRHSCAERVVNHRKVGIPGFSHGHNSLCPAVFQAYDSSFCSSHRAEQSGKVSDPTQLRVKYAQI